MSGKLWCDALSQDGIPAKDDPELQIIKRTITASPFREIIPVVELDRNNVEEKHLVSMLLNVEDDLKEINEPMLFGVFCKVQKLSNHFLAKGLQKKTST